MAAYRDSIGEPGHPSARAQLSAYLGHWRAATDAEESSPVVATVTNGHQAKEGQRWVHWAGKYRNNMTLIARPMSSSWFGGPNGPFRLRRRKVVGTVQRWRVRVLPVGEIA